MSSPDSSTSPALPHSLSHPTGYTSVTPPFPLPPFFYLLRKKGGRREIYLLSFLGGSRSSIARLPLDVNLLDERCIDRIGSQESRSSLAGAGKLQLRVDVQHGVFAAG
jgi:hypothetical protein